MKFNYILLLGIFFFVGYVLNVPADDEVRILNEQLKEFEGEIIVDNNTYSPSKNVIEGNIINKTGKKVEGVIESGFDLLFSIVKGVIDGQ